MTYGETTVQLRQAMTELLRRHRVLQPLGGPGIHTVPATTTMKERRELGQQIQRFRHSTLLWCHQAVEAVTPKFTLSDTMSRHGGPAGELRYQLGDALRALAIRLPGLEELRTPQLNVLVETWRRAACAAALGEHDFPAGVDATRLDANQSRAVLKDAADVVRGLVILDRRYGNVPDWEFFKNPGRLGQAADVCSVLAAAQEPDYSVDRHGWRPPPANISGPALPGIAGAVQAQHNMLIDLARFPNALNLRRIFRSQVEVTHQAGRHAIAAAPSLVEPFLDREQTYAMLAKASRNLGGLIGQGCGAAVEGQNAARRLNYTPASDPGSAPALRELARLFTRTDARIASTLEYGFEQKLYVVSIKYPRLDDHPVNGIVRQRERWVLVTSPVQTDLLPLARDRLRPFPAVPAQAPESIESRHAYEILLTQQFGTKPRSIPSP